MKNWYRSPFFWIPWGLVFGMILASCASLDPVIDLEISETPENAQADIQYCQWLAEEYIADQSAGKAGIGAAGAGIGGAVIPPPDNAPYTQTQGAVGGAIGGAIGGYIAGKMRQRTNSHNLIEKCLEDRGYKILTWR